jgi:hypothetical protein
MAQAYNSYSKSQGKGAIMEQSEGKQIVYRYNGNPYTQDVMSDLKNEMPWHRVGEKVNRNGKEWRVDVVRNDSTLNGIPVQRVFLSNRI